MSTARRMELGYWGCLDKRDNPGPFALFWRAFLPFLAALTMAAAIGYGVRTRALDRDLETSTADLADVVAEALTSRLRPAVDDLRLLQLDVAALLANEPRSVASRLLNMSRSRSTYLAVRLLDVSGAELVHVEGSGSNARIMPSAPQVDWAAREWVRAAAATPAGTVHVSRFELQTADGKIVEPFQPLLRLATSFNASGHGGLIVIDLAANALLSELELQRPRLRLELLSTDGYWIKAHDPALQWGANLPERQHLLFSTQHAQAWEHIQAQRAGFVRTVAGGFWFRTLSAPGNPVRSPQWKLVVHIPDAGFRAGHWHALQALGSLALIAALLAASLFWRLARASMDASYAGHNC